MHRTAGTENPASSPFLILLSFTQLPIAYRTKTSRIFIYFFDSGTGTHGNMADEGFLTRKFGEGVEASAQKYHTLNTIPVGISDFTDINIRYNRTTTPAHPSTAWPSFARTTPTSPLPFDTHPPVSSSSTTSTLWHPPLPPSHSYPTTMYPPWSRIPTPSPNKKPWKPSPAPSTAPF